MGTSDEELGRLLATDLTIDERKERGHRVTAVTQPVHRERRAPADGLGSAG